MNGLLRFKNRSPRFHANLALLRRIGHSVLDLLGREEFDLCIIFVADEEMTRINETRLRHAGTTDVITFDYSGGQEESMVAGEVYICTDEAERQACRYRVPTQQEIVRYLIHAVLHLTGYDDRNPKERRRMKTAEDRLLKRVETKFKFSRIRKSRGARKRIHV